MTDSISSPSPLPGGWGSDWKFQPSNRAWVFPVSSPQPEAILKTTKSHLMSVNSGMVERELFWINKDGSSSGPPCRLEFLEEAQVLGKWVASLGPWTPGQGQSTGWFLLRGTVWIVSWKVRFTRVGIAVCFFTDVFQGVLKSCLPNEWLSSLTRDQLQKSKF